MITKLMAKQNSAIRTKTDAKSPTRFELDNSFYAEHLCLKTGLIWVDDAESLVGKQ